MENHRDPPHLFMADKGCLRMLTETTNNIINELPCQCWLDFHVKVGLAGDEPSELAYRPGIGMCM